MMVGGTGDVKQADAEIQTLIETVRERLEEQVGKTFAQYTAVEYKSQVVAGTNYFVKVQVSDTEFVHVRIFKPLPHVNGLPALVATQLDKKREDTVEYFDS